MHHNITLTTKSRHKSEWRLAILRRSPPRTFVS